VSAASYAIRGGGKYIASVYWQLIMYVSSS